MKVIKRKSNNVVIFNDTKLSMDAQGCYGDGWVCLNIDTSTLTLEPVDTLPNGFIAGGWSHLGSVWTSNTIGDAYLAELAATAAKVTKKAALDGETKTDGDLSLLRVMSGTEIDDWFALNITNLNQTIKMVKKLTKSLVKQGIL